ncbi:MAG: tagaturonate epimerase family protein [Spirochaetia bacterium]|nr:tagaturonate epimerase family protein [Spirochaetia bacterium]
MSTIQYGKLEIDPSINPAVLDTGTWDKDRIAGILKELPEDFFRDIVNRCNGDVNSENIQKGDITCYSRSIAAYKGATYALLGFEDRQSVFICLTNGKADGIANGKADGKAESGGKQQKAAGKSGAAKSSSAGKMAAPITNPMADPMKKLSFSSGLSVTPYPASADNIHTYTRQINPGSGPQRLGPIPRVGIGVRHSTALWPGIWNAMHKADFSANAIQNSVRELYLLDALYKGEAPRKNHLFSFGPVDEGHTGSSFEGLWAEGVLSSLKQPNSVRYGADADHLQVKRGSEGIERTKQFIDAARYYSFYTLDVSDILDYSALSSFSAKNSTQYLEELIPSAAERRDILWYHKRKKSLGKQFLQLDEAQIGRLVGKYWKALQSVGDLSSYIDSIKDGESYDLELSVDENPPFIRTFDSITTYAEMLFLVDEIERRGLPISHIAPNFGVEKGTDYRGDDGRLMFENRVGILHKIASEKDLMLDCHSGDDLSRETRRLFKRATRGNIHFKISPSLQALYGEVLSEIDPEFFDFWWKDTLAYAEEGAKNGSSFAKYSLSLLKRGRGQITPSADHLFFKELCFATLGRRDNRGQFVNREKFYDLPSEFYEEMERRVEAHMLEVAADLFDL